MMDAPDFLYPLSEFYLRTGLPLPSAISVEGEAVPEPYRSLLVHDADMTSTLERFHGAKCHLSVLEKHHDDSAFSRLVVLTLDGSEKPVEFGAITIYLNRFSPETVDLIRAGQRPLGAILQVHATDYVSCPKTFLQLTSDSTINQALQLKESQVLYGRRNTLFNRSSEPLADIVEILPPL